MNLINKIILSLGAVTLLLCQQTSLTSCSDDMPAESYYTFTGKMMSDYLKTDERFSLFTRIVERAKVMDLLSARGEYTLFPPVNSAIESYLKENHYASVEDIPEAYCDTIAYSHLMRYVYATSDFGRNATYSNYLDMPLNIVVTDSLDENNLSVSVINSCAAIINTLKNDSVENGIIHPVDHIILPNTDNGATLLENNMAAFRIYYEAFERVGLLDSLAVSYLDMDYERIKESYPDPWPQILLSGMDGNTYRAKRPDHRRVGFIVFIVPDDKLLPLLKMSSGNHGLTTDDMESCMKALYDFAVQRYAPTARQLGIDAGKWKSFEEMTIADFREPTNPLYLFMAYHILDRFLSGTDKFVNRWGINTLKANPTEWVGTMLPYSTLKIEAVYNDAPQGTKGGAFYINHAKQEVSSDGGEIRERVPGAVVTQPSNHFAQNCAFYYLDNVIAYDETMIGTVMQTRMRMDVISLFPELTTNNIRLSGEPWFPQNKWDTDPDYRHGTNYYIPNGYLEKARIESNGLLFVMRPHNTFWNMGGDEINLFGSSYNFTMELPAVPEGTYEIRLGAGFGIDTRGVAQVYYDGAPQGIPIDMRIAADHPSIGGIYGGGLTEDELMDNNQLLKNKGIYRCGASIFSYYGGEGQNQKEPGRYVPGKVRDFIDVPLLFRKVICKVHITPHERHTIGFRSVYSSGTSSCFMIDYIELVPNSICGVGGFGEDEN